MRDAEITIARRHNMQIWLSFRFKQIHMPTVGQGQVVQKLISSNPGLNL